MQRFTAVIKTTFDGTLSVGSVEAEDARAAIAEIEGFGFVDEVVAISWPQHNSLGEHSFYGLRQVGPVTETQEVVTTKEVTVRDAITKSVKL